MPDLMELQRQVDHLARDFGTWRRDAGTRPIRQGSPGGVMGYTQFGVVREIGDGTEPYIMVQRLRQISADPGWVYASDTYERVACYGNLVSAEYAPFICTVPDAWDPAEKCPVIPLVRANLSWVACPWTAREIVNIEELVLVPRTDAFPPVSGGRAPVPTSGEAGEDEVVPADLDDLVDVTIAGDQANNEILAWDTATEQWVNQTLAEAGIASSAFFNGTFVESFDALVTSDGATVTMSLEQSGGGNLMTQFSDGHTPLDCTPPATIELTAGTDTVPVLNRVYLLRTAPTTLVVTTGLWPSVEHIRVGVFLIPSATFVQTYGAYTNHNLNDHASDSQTGQGHLTHITERIRNMGSQWISGCQGTATVDVAENPDAVWVSMTEGIASQLHRHVFAALDTDPAGGNDIILVINQSGTPFDPIQNLANLTHDSTGTPLGANKYVSVVLWAVINKTGEFSPMGINLPSGTYNTLADAQQDLSGYTDYSRPSGFGIESTLGFLVARFILKNSANMTVEDTLDLRGFTPETAGGGGGAGDVVAAAPLTDHKITRGDGGAKGIQTSGIGVDDADNMSGVTSILAGNVSIFGNTVRRIPIGPGNLNLQGGSEATDQVIALHEFKADDGFVLDDNKKIIFGTGADVEQYFDGSDFVIDPNGNDIRIVSDHVGINAALDANAILTIGGSTADRVKAIGGTLIYTGVSQTVSGLRFSTSHAGSHGSPILEGSWAKAQLDTDVASAGTGAVAGAYGEASTTHAQSNQKVQPTITMYGVHGYATGNKFMGHSGGDFVVASIFGEAPVAANGATSSIEFAGLFDGAVQVTSGNPIILEGTITSKGDTYLIFQNNRIEFFLHGTLEGYVDATGFVSA